MEKRNEERLLDMIENANDPVRALVVAIQVIQDFLEHPQSSQ